MSNTFRERLARAKRRILEALGMTEADWQHMQEYMGNYCSESDAQMRLLEGENCNVDDVVARMTESDFIDMVRSVVDAVNKRTGYVLEKKRKKKKQDQQEEDDINEVQEESVPEEATEEEVAQEIPN